MFGNEITKRKGLLFLIATRTDSKNRLGPPHDSDKHCIWLEGLVCASTDFSKKNHFFFVFMIGNGRHQALFVGKLYDGLDIPDKMAGFAKKNSRNREGKC